MSNITKFSHTHFFLLVLVITNIFQIYESVEGQGNVAVGASLIANNENNLWKSPLGDFAFGFQAIQDEEDRFLLAIWYANIPERTIVWFGNKGNPVERGSKVELIGSGHLVLKDPRNSELWRSESLNYDAEVSHAAMLDTGNFVIESTNLGYIWESFKYPTNTILPTQEMDVNGSLSSISTEKNYRKGKYQLRFSEGYLLFNQIDMFTDMPYNNYSSLGQASRLIFNESGFIQTKSSEGVPIKLAPTNAIPNTNSTYYRATLEFDGVFAMYAYPRNPSEGESWSTMWSKPDDICSNFDDLGELGNGPCGYNSICESISGRPNCTCPPGFSPFDENNQYTGCKQDYVSYPGDCSLDGSTIQEDRLDFESTSFIDFPYSDYGVFQTADELACRLSCLRDCTCVVAIFLDPDFDNGTGKCWKKKLPLLNGQFNRDSIRRTALFKVLKSNATPNPIDNNQNQNRNRVVLILSVLLGTSAVFNFISLTAISLIFFCLYQRRLWESNKSPRSRDLETNLRSFTYKDLEQATNGFKEELGNGSFGTVYKGELQSSYGNYVAVKKLDKFVQEGEREFKTEVKVIGQTHHKNLVRLLGYCDEGEPRLLVYEFMQNGSLSSLLFGLLRPSWQQRLQIASGIAKGLAYLHEECSTQIIHCDIKPQNILLDDAYTAKISDFGLAKLLINSKTRTLTGIRGTKGYVAPEWFRNKPVMVKVDVYSFGVMLLEIICCRKCVEVEMEEAAILTEWAYECYREGMVEKLVENDEEARSDIGKLKMLLKVAIWCVQDEPLLRPSMRTISMMLEGAVQVPSPPCPFPGSMI